MTQSHDMDRGALARDLLVFQMKLAADGLKDIAVFWATLLAGLIDLVLAKTVRTRFFYRVLHASHAFDGALDLHKPARSRFHGGSGV